VTAPALPPSDTTALLEPNSEVVPEPEAEHRAFRLRKGAARFTVVHDAKRPFRVKVGSAVVEDLGTVFTVRRLSETVAEVIVSEGRVHVSATDASFDVGAGERRTFTTDVPAADAAAEPEARGTHAPAVASWRPLAESGRFGEAYVAMKATGPSSVRDETGELLLAADVARLSGHPADAVPYLERILRSRGSDPRAGLAAFTLGRVFLEELGRPAEAASAFARARKAGGPLAEDALARQVEASSRAGEAGSARALALEYQKQYPNGRRMRRVVKFGGLD
jgi:transmembrane sensor